LFIARQGHERGTDPDVLQDLAERECVERLRREVLALPRYEQELFLMKARGLKEREIAAQMGKPQGTVSADWLRLRRRLRERLRKAGCV
jgi:DNA-directed RNA polymerase specialized sigma24 family protein